MKNLKHFPGNFINRFGFRFLGFLVLIIVLCTSDWGVITRQFGNISAPGLILMLALIIPGIGLKAWRWHTMLLLQNIHYPFFKSLAVYSYSTGLGFLSPGRLGEFSKIVILSREKDQPFAKVLVSFVAERILDFSLIVVMFVWGLSFFVLKHA